MQPPTPSAGGLIPVIINGDVRIPMVTMPNCGVGFPKGRRTGDETLEETALREVQEETGLSGLEIIEKLGSVMRQSSNDEDGMKEVTLFIMRASSLAEESEGEVIWMKVDVAVRRCVHKGDGAFIEAHMDRIIALADQDPAYLKD